jgi:hypothetical protein
MYVDGSNGNVGIATTSPTATLSVNGTANKTGGGSWTVFSDKRVKRNIAPYKDGLEKILAINPVKFKYVKEFALPENEDKEFVGVIAQEIKDIAPYMVETYFGFIYLVLTGTVVKTQESPSSGGNSSH